MDKPKRKYVRKTPVSLQDGDVVSSKPPESDTQTDLRIETAPQTPALVRVRCLIGGLGTSLGKLRYGEEAFLAPAELAVIDAIRPGRYEVL